MRKVLSLILCLMLAMTCIFAVAEEAAPVKTGLSLVTTASEARGGGVQTNLVLAAVTVDDNGVIDACVFDYIQAKITFDATGLLTTDKATVFQSKQELGDAYGMRGASSISAEWNEQANAFAAYCVGKTLEEVKGMALTEDGKGVDVISSCTLAVSEFLPGLEAAVNNAAHLGAKKGDALKLVSTANAGSSKDATETAEGQAHVYAHVGAVTLNGETITSCYIDAVQAATKFNAKGEITSELGVPFTSKNDLQDGYGMRKASPIGKEWFEQAAGFCAYVTGKTIAEVANIAIVEGKIADADLAATTTIGIGDFQTLIEKAGK